SSPASTSATSRASTWCSGICSPTGSRGTSTRSAEPWLRPRRRRRSRRAPPDRALASATRQMVPGDELVVVFDDSGDAGDTPRNRVLGSLRGTHVTFLDDDDVYRPGALEAIRRFARAN